MSTTFDFSSRKREGIRTGFSCVGPSLTVQSHRDSTNINNIIARFQRTGELPPPVKPAQYADISSVQQLDPTDALQLSRSTLQKVGEGLQSHRENLEKQKYEQQVQKIRDEVEKELSQKLGAPLPSA